MNFLVENYDDENPNQELEDLILELNQITKEGYAEIPTSFRDKLWEFIHKNNLQGESQED